MLDPFGKRAREILKEFENINSFLEIIPTYLDINLALERVVWLKDNVIPRYILDTDDLKDLMGFYALLGALAFSPYGFEMELVKEANLRIYLTRIEKSKNFEELSLSIEPVSENEIPQRDLTIIEKRLHSEISPEERDRIALKYKIKLKDFLSLNEGSLKSVYIKKGYAYLTRNQVIDLWKKSFERNLERAVNLLYELRDELPQYYLQLYNRLSEIAREHFKKRFEKVGKASTQPLRFDLFPPCVKIALGGVPSGLRNYAITVLLTSFLSYARICPNPPSKNVRIKDCIKDLSIIEKEILPIIIEAGNRCSPPLFEDQPNEIKNIWYHLGFGYTSKPRLEDSGTSTWYFPPNCSKIRANAPQLCKPDKDCKYIKNPLTYYLRKLYLESKKENPGEERNE
ncbi:DNA primase large subunit PriL [Thermococcus sp. M39]|uniref:DNA primase large subunit PriL n=1 Tax=unclassified Thermococcus TaxID=2627626 RepID=UPI0014389A86|nr:MULTISPECIES: DNA primase large subunit PriL [unclassified Thermococcus]NJE08212.1 DNA primase large subunit PriL [Thermococcus sp. M39]NJE11705.1 DNA primase large subunit PriL [Thermococcus sp. LS2]